MKKKKKTFWKALQSQPRCTHFFIVYQLLENFTLWRRRKKRRSPPRTHLYSSSSLNRHLWCCSRCASFVGFTLIQLPENTHTHTLQERITIRGGEKKTKKTAMASLGWFFMTVCGWYFIFPVERLPPHVYKASWCTSCQFCMYRVDQCIFRHWQGCEHVSESQAVK